MGANKSLIVQKKKFKNSIEIFKKKIIAPMLNDKQWFWNIKKSTPVNFVLNKRKKKKTVGLPIFEKGPNDSKTRNPIEFLVRPIS